MSLISFMLSWLMPSLTYAELSSIYRIFMLNDIFFLFASFKLSLIKSIKQVEEALPEKPINILSPCFIIFDFPKVARNLCLKYSRKHPLQYENFVCSTTLALLAHFLQMSLTALDFGI
uniref:Putative secreted protein n=1 Tax=Panstrongylus lignarius TaxID=156445 RepID=A0A224Y0I2_9HEMI